MEKTAKKKVGEIIVEKFLEQVEKEGVLPWQRPYNRYCAFNWMTLTQYRGINRIILPMGEYLTMNQIISYNKKHGTNYRYNGEGQWWSVVFFKRYEKVAYDKEVEGIIGSSDYDDFQKAYPKGVAKDGWFYYPNDTYKSVFKRRNILRYTNVTDRTSFVDEERGVLPSRLENGDVEITRFKPKELFENYIKREKIKVIEMVDEVPCYIPALDKIKLNMAPKSEDFFWSYAFHEAAHSTGSVKRLDRDLFEYFNSERFDSNSEEYKNLYSIEECIAEIASSMVCSECDIVEFNTSECDVYKNNLAYVNSYKKRIKDWGDSFIYIAHQAELAYERIMGDAI